MLTVTSYCHGCRFSELSFFSAVTSVSWDPANSSRCFMLPGDWDTQEVDGVLSQGGDFNRAIEALPLPQAVVGFRRCWNSTVSKVAS